MQATRFLTTLTYAEQVIERGFSVIPGVLQDADCDALARTLSASPRMGGRAGIRHALSIPAVAALAQSPVLTDIVTAMLGPNAVPFRATFFDKSIASNWLVVWHQDTALPLSRKHNFSGWGPWSTKNGVVYAHAPASALSRVLAIRVHVDASTDRNGPLRVLPGTHRCGVLTDDEVSQLASELRGHSCTVSRGGVLAMRPLLVHASSKFAAMSPEGCCISSMRRR